MIGKRMICKRTSLHRFDKNRAVDKFHRPGSAPVAWEEGRLAHSALRLMTHLVYVLPGYFSMRYREVTSNVDTIDIFDSTNKYEAGIGIKHMPEFSWVNHNHVCQLA